MIWKVYVMNKPVFLLGVLVCCALTTKLSAQSLDPDYKTAVGVKFGWWESASLSVKHFISDHTAIEGLVYFWQYGGEGCGLYEYHMAIPSVEGLKWYAGGEGISGYTIRIGQKKSRIAIRELILAPMGSWEWIIS